MARLELLNFVVNAGGAPSIQENLQANMPAAGVAGRIFISTDTKLIFRDNGVSWDIIGGGGIVGADNGLSVDPISGDVVMGNDFAGVQDAALISFREIDLAGFSIFFDISSNAANMPFRFVSIGQNPFEIDGISIQEDLTSFPLGSNNRIGINILANDVQFDSFWARNLTNDGFLFGSASSFGGNDNLLSFWDATGNLTLSDIGTGVGTDVGIRWFIYGNQGMRTLNAAGVNPITSLGWDTVTGELLANDIPVFSEIKVTDGAGHTFDIQPEQSNITSIGADWSTANPLFGMSNANATFQMFGDIGSDFSGLPATDVGALEFALPGQSTFLIYTSAGNLIFWNSFSPIPIGAISDSLNFAQFYGDIETKSGSILNGSPETTDAGSISGNATFSQPEQGSSYKKVIIHLAALVGTATYNFPTAFLFTPVVMQTTGLATAKVTSLSTSAVTVTGAADTGFLIIEGK